MPRYHRKLALLVKAETTYGTDSVPTALANAILASNVVFTPLEGGEEERDNIVSYFGHQGVVLTGLYERIEFSVEIAGAGAAGTVPGYGALLKACGLSETVTVATSVVYAPVSALIGSASIYYVRDGVRHILLGARGTVTLEFAANRIPRFRFTMTGLIGTVSDQAVPTATLTAFQKPLAVSKANTTFALHGLNTATESVTIDLGNVIEPRLLMNSDSIELTDRRVTGQAVMEAVTVATKNWNQIARAGTTGGNIVEVAGATVQIGRYGEGQSQGIVNNTLPFMMLPGSGNDEISITVK